MREPDSTPSPAQLWVRRALLWAAAVAVGLIWGGTLSAWLLPDPGGHGLGVLVNLMLGAAGGGALMAVVSLVWLVKTAQRAVSWALIGGAAGVAVAGMALMMALSAAQAF